MSCPDSFIIYSDGYTRDVQQIHSKKLNNFNIFSELKMVRKLQYHEQKLLRKVNFVSWEASNNLHENKVMRLVHISFFFLT